MTGLNTQAKHHQALSGKTIQRTSNLLHPTKPRSHTLSEPAYPYPYLRLVAQSGRSKVLGNQSENIAKPDRAKPLGATSKAATCSKGPSKVVHSGFKLSKAVLNEKNHNHWHTSSRAYNLTTTAASSSGAVLLPCISKVHKHDRQYK